MKHIIALTLMLAACSPVTAQSESFIFVAGEPSGINGDNLQFLVYHAGNPDRFYGRFNYFEELDTPGLDAPAGWIGGDRVQYRCGWAFLTYRQWIVGRVTYTVLDPDGAGGQPQRAQLNDDGMVEGSRHYDGAPDWKDEPSRDQFDDECERVPNGDGISTAGPFTNYPERPVGSTFNAKPVVFYHGPHDIEIRDFTDLEDTTVPIHSSLRLDTVAQTERRVTMVGYERRSNGMYRASVEIHFDIMRPGEIVPGTPDPVELRTTLDA